MSKQHKHGEHTQHNHGGQQTWQKAHDKKAHETEKHASNHAHDKKHEHTENHSWKHESEDLDVEEDD